MRELSSVYALIMAGGSGTRLWPESRKACPKQFLRFEGMTSLLEETVKRLNSFIPQERIFVSGLESRSELLSQTLADLPKENFLLEPCPRNTAPSIGWGAEKFLQKDPQAVMIVLPSDQFIEPIEKFQEYLASAVRLVRESPDRLITLGVIPTFPHTGYGYIKKGKKLRSSVSDLIKKDSGIQPFTVEKFMEKPPLETAKKYLQSGRFLWNSGIFIWNARTILDILDQCEPELLNSLEKIKRVRSAKSFDALYSSLKSISIDYAVMERAKNIVVLPADFHWDDLGSFISLARLHPEKNDDWGNVAFHSEVIALDARNNIIRRIKRTTDTSENQFEIPDQSLDLTENSLLDNDPSHRKTHHLTALIGVENLILVESDDVLMVIRKDLESKIPELLKKIESENYRKFL